MKDDGRTKGGELSRLRKDNMHGEMMRDTNPELADLVENGAILATWAIASVRTPDLYSSNWSYHHKMRGHENVSEESYA
jgi:hypothetical protein